MAASTSTSHPAAGGSTRTGGNASNQLYALASRVPLIKSPSISLPKPVTLPADLHPLPHDISAYFVYPFSLESYVLDPNTPSSTTIDQLLEKHAQYLKHREEDKQKRQRDMLHKLAPGWQGASGVLQPTSTAWNQSNPSAGQNTNAVQPQHQEQQQQQQQERTPLDDLADHLAQLDALHSQPPPTSEQPSS
ncbi:uncharacterized protein PAN0_014d4992 [Moesziomyces antarcticus]|uniref:Uncharacterized protein n=2 Tax=Pseudozyma antarctica TaxID=84753 RepID=A0A5C3FW75_PSEA2|nr:uncharacterized protein PAN0_014d4992 [Moesziomyces antarcticus]GAK66768.1 conserved hypothetical protein [Moesziomyces antarcticus]SPO47817.1 uncharacterized protein PSANT_05505 [Moesziomyces antarcticus]